MKYTPIIINRNHPMRESIVSLSSLFMGLTILIFTIFNIFELITIALCAIFFFVMLLIIIECSISDKIGINPRESGERRENNES